MILHIIHSPSFVKIVDPFKSLTYVFQQLRKIHITVSYSTTIRPKINVSPGKNAIRKDVTFHGNRRSSPYSVYVIIKRNCRDIAVCVPPSICIARTKWHGRIAIKIESANTSKYIILPRTSFQIFFPRREADVEIFLIYFSDGSNEDLRFLSLRDQWLIRYRFICRRCQ